MLFYIHRVYLTMADLFWCRLVVYIMFILSGRNHCWDCWEFCSRSWWQQVAGSHLTSDKNILLAMPDTMAQQLVYLYIAQILNILCHNVFLSVSVQTHISACVTLKVSWCWGRRYCISYSLSSLYHLGGTIFLCGWALTGWEETW